MSEAKPNPLRRIALPEAGDGVFLIFRNRVFRTLQDEQGPNYFEHVMKSLMRAEIDVMDRLLTLGTFKDGAEGLQALNLTMDDFDEVPIETVQMKLLDAFTMASAGRTYEEHVKWLAEQIKDSDASPPPSLEAISAGSTEPPAGPESETPTSGI